MRVFVFSPTRRQTAWFVCVMLALAALAFTLTGGAAAVFAPKENIPIYSVKTSGNQIALTLDVAWGSQMTGEQLDIFDRYNVKATFYVTGRWAELNADELREIAGRGHEIGSHGHTHRDFVKLSQDEMVKELSLASDAIEKASGSPPATFRAPYGSWNGKTVDVVCGQKYEFVQWDVETRLIKTEYPALHHIDIAQGGGMARTYTAKSGRFYSVTDLYPKLTEEEGKRRQQEAVHCVVKLMREQRAAEETGSSAKSSSGMVSHIAEDSRD